MIRLVLSFPSVFRCIRIALMLALSAQVVGCALIPLAAVGTVADIAASAASTGPEVYQMGKLDLAYQADFGAVQKAVRLGAYDLRLIVKDDPDTFQHPGVWACKLQDNRGSPITITIDACTPMLCRCRVDVGIFGSQTTAKLVMARISVHLAQSSATHPDP